MLKRNISFIMLSVSSCLCMAQTFSGQYISEGQWNMNNKANWLNQLRLNLQLPIAHGKGAFEAATLHLAKTNEAIAADWQTFSNIEADNMLAAIAVLGYMQGWTWGAHLCGRKKCERRLLHLRHHCPLHKQFVWHLSHYCRQLPHSQLSLLGADAIF